MRGRSLKLDFLQFAVSTLFALAGYLAILPELDRAHTSGLKSFPASLLLKRFSAFHFLSASVKLAMDTRCVFHVLEAALLLAVAGQSLVAAQQNFDSLITQPISLACT